MSASPALSVPCLPSCVSLSGGVRLAGLVRALSPFICLPSCVSLSGGVRLSGLVCALSPFMCLPEWWCPSRRSCPCLVSLHLSVFICLPEWWCPPLRSCLCLVSLHLSPFMCFPEWRCPPLRSCRLRLSPIVSPFVCLCLDGMTHCLPLSSLHMCLRWISEVLPPLVSHCLPTSAPVLDGVSAFPRSCLTWSSFLCPSVGWYARFPVLSPLVSYVSHCLQLSVIVSPHASPPSQGLVSPCVPSCFPLLDGASAPLALDYLPLSPFLFPFVGWCAFPRTCPPCPPACLPACLPACQVVFPSCSLWCPPSSLFPFLFPFLGWCARLPEALSPSWSPSWCLFLFPFVGWCVRLPEALSLLSLAYLPACLPSCFPLLGGVSVFPLVSHCLPSFFPLLDGLSAFPSPCPVCLPACVPVCLPFCFPLLEGASTFLRCCLFCFPACLPACLPACFQLAPQLVSQLVSPLFPS